MKDTKENDKFLPQELISEFISLFDASFISNLFPDIQMLVNEEKELRNSKFEKTDNYNL